LAACCAAPLFRAQNTRSITRHIFLLAAETSSSTRNVPPAAAPASIYPSNVSRLGSPTIVFFKTRKKNFYGAHVWWEPKDTAFRLRSEFARGHHAQGYWIEADYRTQAFGGLDSFIGRFEPVFRMQQTFRRDTIVSDDLPLVNTQRADFGLDYNLPHNTRIITSYARQFSSTGNRNIWETGIVYRFLFPAWKGKSK